MRFDLPLSPLLPCQALPVFQSCLLSRLTGLASHDECGTGPSPGSCHYPVTIYYPLSVGTINPGPGNRDLSVLHYQDLPMSPSLSVTWRTYTQTHTPQTVWVFSFSFYTWLPVSILYTQPLSFQHTLLISAPFTCPFVPCHTHRLMFIEIWNNELKHRQQHLSLCTFWIWVFIIH